MRCLPHVIHLAALEVRFHFILTIIILILKYLDFFQLLVKLGVLSTANTSSKDVAYQDSATEPAQRNSENDVRAALQPMDPDDEFVPPANSVGNAIYKVQITTFSFVVSIADLYEQLRKIVRHTRSSPQRREAWKAIARKHLSTDEREMALLLILDVKTRWSSTHQMLREYSLDNFCI
jgi:hypothetical protein